MLGRYLLEGKHKRDFLLFTGVRSKVYCQSTVDQPNMQDSNDIKVVNHSTERNSTSVGNNIIPILINIYFYLVLLTLRPLYGWPLQHINASLNTSNMKERTFRNKGLNFQINVQVIWKWCNLYYCTFRQHTLWTWRCCSMELVVVLKTWPLSIFLLNSNLISKLFH